MEKNWVKIDCRTKRARLFFCPSIFTKLFFPLIIVHKIFPFLIDIFNNRRNQAWKIAIFGWSKQKKLSIAVLPVFNIRPKMCKRYWYVIRLSSVWTWSNIALNWTDGDEKFGQLPLSIDHFFIASNSCNSSTKFEPQVLNKRRSIHNNWSSKNSYRKLVNKTTRVHFFTYWLFLRKNIFELMQVYFQKKFANLNQFISIKVLGRFKQLKLNCKQ